MTAPLFRGLVLCPACQTECSVLRDGDALEISRECACELTDAQRHALQDAARTVVYRA